MDKVILMKLENVLAIIAGIMMVGFSVIVVLDAIK
jgi:hypothetical protein